VELLLIGAALGLSGIVWVSRVRSARRFNAAVDAYAEREISRESRHRPVPMRIQEQWNLALNRSKIGGW
jgi:hypothetical protein